MSTSPPAASGASGKRPLPDGWRWARLGEICRVFAGSAAPQGEQYFDNDGPFFFRVSDLGRYGRTTNLAEARDRLSPEAVESRQLVRAKKGSVLFPKSGAAIATNNRAILAVDGYIVSHLMALEARESVLPEWLYYATCRMDMMVYSDNTGYPSLKQSVAQQIEIPLPPLSEQRRVVLFLNERMAAVEHARRAAVEMIEHIDALKNAFLREIFALGKNLAQGWRWVTLADLLELADSGTWGPADPNNGVSVLRSTNFRSDGKLDFSSLSFRSISLKDRERKSLRPGDIVLERSGGGPSQPVGRVCIFEGDGAPHTFGNFCQRLRAKRAICNPEFLFWYLYAFHATGQTEAYQKRTTGIRNLEYQLYINLQVPLPPLPEQRRIVTSLNERMAIAEQARTAAQKQLDAINALPSSILRMAFAGQLR